jgi:leucine-rich repeat-containing protein 49
MQQNLNKKPIATTAKPFSGVIANKGVTGATAGRPGAGQAVLDVGVYGSNPNLSQQQKIDITKLSQSEEDERYRYLLKNGIVRKIEDEDKIIFAELPQIPGVLVVYRKPSERNANPERLNLDKRDLTHMPLLEGEERLRLLNLQHNHITKIENLVSLPQLIFLDLYNN